MYCLHCKYTTKLRNDKKINAFFASYKGVQQSLLHQQSNHAPTLQSSHRLQKTSGARYSPTDCTYAQIRRVWHPCHTHAAHQTIFPQNSRNTQKRLAEKKNLCTSVKSVGGSSPPEASVYSVKSVGEYSPPEASVYSVNSVGEYSPPEASVYSVNSVGGLAQTNLEWVLWKEFGGRRGYGRDALPSYICGPPHNPWEDCDVGAAETAAPPKDCHATTTRLPRYDNKIATLRQQGCHATAKCRETDVR